MKRAHHLLHPILLLLLLILACPDGVADELFQASGRKLKTSQRGYIEKRIKGLRDSNYIKRFETVEYLIDLDRIALPILISEAEKNSNPMLVRCILLALTEIGGREAISVLENVVKSSGSDRDEKIVAALGMGKLDQAVDLDALRALVEPGSNRFVRKAAALGLACRKDRAAAQRLIKLAKSEKEDELSSLLLLAGLMMGEENVIKAMPQLFKSMKGHKRSVLALGAAFLADPILLPSLITYGNKDDKIHDGLAISLGQFQSPEAADLLAKIALSTHKIAAKDALYSIGYQERARAKKAYRTVLETTRFPSVKAHCILALADAGLLPDFIESVHQALKDQEAEVRSAAALALKGSTNRETAIRLGNVLKTEKKVSVVSDILMVLGLMGGTQFLPSVESWYKRLKAEPGTIAEQAFKVIKGKLDPRVLEESYEKRLSQLSAKWEYRFRDGVMREVFKGLELDRIEHRVLVEEPADTGGDTGNDDPSGGGDEGGDSGEPSANPPPSGSSSGDDTVVKKKILYRYEVVERDLLLWFKGYPYFSDSTFQRSR